MNCVSEGCKYVRCENVKIDGCKSFKSMLVFECALGRSISYPLIDDHTRDMRCECFERQKADKGE